MFLVLISLLLTIGCSLFQFTPAPQSSPAPRQASSTTPAPSATAPAPSATQTPIPLPSETPTPTLEPQVDLRQALQAILRSSSWPVAGLDPQRLAAWTQFAESGTALSEGEQQSLQAFVSRWQMLQELMQAGPIPADTHPDLRVREVADSQGNPQPVLYVMDESASTTEKGERLFLIAHDASGQASALVLSSRIDKLSQRISPDGMYVEYVEEDGGWLVRADARQLDLSLERQQILKEYLDRGSLPQYNLENAVYGRFFFNIPQVESGFYAIELLTYNQILLLQSTLALFSQGNLQGLGPEVFAPGDLVEYIISREPNAKFAALALPLGGDPPEGVITLFTRNLFNNKYETAAAIAHEAAHIWQGQSPGCDEPEKLLQREIANQSIPPGFYDWTGTELFQAVRSGQIGAYHVSYWVLLHFRQERLAAWQKQIIQTGTADGQSLLTCP